MLEQPDLQERTLRLYGELLCRRPSWAGQLVLAAFGGASASGLAAAASLAGAASLTIDSGAAAMKAAFRDGAFDFVVTTLDEALRAIKNEVRRQRPIALGLIAAPEDVLREAAERGLAAALVLCAAGGPSLLEQSVADVEAIRLTSGGLEGNTPALDAWLKERRWRPVAVGRASAASVVVDDVRLRWVKDLSKYQRSARGGDVWAWLTTEEQQMLLPRAR